MNMVFYFAKFGDEAVYKAFNTLEEAFEFARTDDNSYDVQVVIDYLWHNIYSKDATNYNKFNYWRFRNTLFDVYNSYNFKSARREDNKLIRIDYEISGRN